MFCLMLIYDVSCVSLSASCQGASCVCFAENIHVIMLTEIVWEGVEKLLKSDWRL